jgi:hypothetical protein
MNRPVKGNSDRLRRERVHRKRLVALGMPEDRVAKMTHLDVRTLLKNPKKVPTLAAR